MSVEKIQDLSQWRALERGTWLMGEEKEVAWPERSEGLVRPVLCVPYSSEEKQVLFLSMPFQSWVP